MKLRINYFSRLSIFMLVSVLLLTAGGCKSKKLAQQAAQAKAQQEEALRKQKEEEMKKKEAEEKARKAAADEEERKAREAKANVKVAPASTEVRLEQYFTAISTAANLNSANSSINEALSLFSSEQTPVLIVISEEGGEKDYDKPTTIKQYLNYLKDQKKNINRISNLVLDDAGKIKEVELVKK
jgi:hypothetical protein